MHKIFIISGPSGVGKTTVARKIIKKIKNLQTTVTYTTRTKRLGKKEDKTVIHVSEEKFKAKIERGDFLEWAVVHDNYYGTDKKIVFSRLRQSHLLMNIDVQGALQIKKRLPRQTILIFLKADSIKELIRRISRRERMPKAIMDLRIKNAKKEISLSQYYNYTVINKENAIKATVDKVALLIQKEMVE